MFFIVIAIGILKNTCFSYYQKAIDFLHILLSSHLIELLLVLIVFQLIFLENS